MRGECAALPTGGVMQVTRAGKTTPEWAFVARHVAPVVGRGDKLLLIEDAGQLFVVAILGESPVVPPVVAPDPPAEGAPETGTRITGTTLVPPVWTGTYRSGSWRSDTAEMIQGPSSWGMSQGAAFFGRALASVTGDITRLSLHFERLTFGTYAAQQPTVALLSGQTRPSGAPTVRATATGPTLTGPGSTADWTVPAAWLADINSGAAGGFGLVGTSTYMRISGPRFRALATWEDG